MATYLLKAPDEDMARWKHAAARAGVSFADYLRGCLNRGQPPAMGRGKQAPPSPPR